MSSTQHINPHILEAWLRLCQIEEDNGIVETPYDISKVDNLVTELKKIMLYSKEHILADLANVMKNYGIVFSVINNFKGALVQGYLFQKIIVLIRWY